MNQASVRLSDRAVLQVGDNLGALDGASVVDLNDTIRAALKTAFAAPHGLIYLAADGTVTYDPPPTPAAPTPDGADITTVKAYLGDTNLDTILGIADGSLSPGQRDYAVKNGIRTLRALTRILRGIAT